MTTIDIKIAKIIKSLGDTDESTLDLIIGVLGNSSTKSKDENAISVLPEEVLKGIKRGQNQIKKGQYTTHEVMKAEYRKQYPNANI
ncbi:MAG: hypothetical protein GQ574_27140 [Crocinitomix sp.]|nr:hypothetical protein [Crocinitomix sp.]